MKCVVWMLVLATTVAFVQSAPPPQAEGNARVKRDDGFDSMLKSYSGGGAGSSGGGGGGFGGFGSGGGGFGGGMPGAGGKQGPGLGELMKMFQGDGKGGKGGLGEIIEMLKNLFTQFMAAMNGNGKQGGGSGGGGLADLMSRFNGQAPKM